MSSVDNRVVNMEFNNRDFSTKIADTMSSLQKLDKALKFENGQAGLNDVANAANNMDFSGMEAGIQTLTNRFSTLGIVGMTVISKITSGIMDFAHKIGGKVISGGISRAMGLEHAAFMLEGIIHDAKQEAAVMEDVKQSVDGTAYSLDQAANVAAQFVATGMRSGDELRTILKGVTGISAVFEADYDRVGQIFTQVSAQGRVYANDLLSLSTMGVNAKAALVDYYKEVKHQSDVSIESIDEMVRKGKIDFETFGNAMAYAFGDQAKQANRTFSGAMSNVNAHLAQIGEKFIRPFIAAKESLDDTKISTYNLVDVLNAFRGVIDRVRDTLGSLDVYDNWAKGVSKVSEVITKFLNAIATDPNKDIGGFLKSIEDLQKALGMNDKDFKNLVDTFYGIVDVFKIAKNILVDFIDALLPAGSSVENLGSKILEVTGSIGRFVTDLRDASDKTDFFSKSFMTIGNVIKFVGGIISAVFNTVSGILTGAGGNIVSFFNGTMTVFEKMKTALSPVGKSISSIFGEIKDIIVELFGEIGKVLATGNTDSLINFFKVLVSGGIGLEVVSFLQNLNRMTQDILTGFSNTDIVRKAKFLFGNLNTILKEFAVGIRIDNLLKIAKAVGILAASLLLLSLIKPERLMGALLALEVLIQNVSSIMTQLGALTKGGTLAQMGGMASIGASMVTLATSLVIMSGAVLILASIPFAKMVQGLVGIGVLLGGLVIFMKSIQSKAIKTTAPRIASIAKSMVVLGIALNLLAFAVRQLGNLKTESLDKGLIGIAVLLVELVGFMYLTKKMTVDPKSMAGLVILAASLLILSKVVKTIGKLKPEQLAKGLIGLGFVLLELAGFIKLVSGSTGIVKASVGMLALAVAMTVMTDAIGKLGDMSEEQLAKGLLSLGGSLLIIAGVMRLMPTNMLATSVGLLVAAQAIQMIAVAMASMGGMSAEEMAKGLISMAGALGILALAMYAMNSAVAGAAAMIIAAAGLAILVPPLIALGNMPLPAIVTALVGLAGVFLVLGVAGTALTPLAPVLVGIAGAIALLGVGMLAAGAGIMLFVSALILVIQNFDALVKAIPPFLEALASCAESVAMVGIQIMLALMSAIADNIQQFIDLGISIVVNFVNGIASKIGDIVDAAYNLITSFINGLANGLNEHGPELIAAVMNLMGAIINYVLEGLRQIADGMGVFGSGAAKEIEKTQKKVADFFGDGTVKKATEQGTKETTDAAKKGAKNTAKAFKKETDAIPKFSKKAMKDAGMSFNVLPKDAKKAFGKVSGDKTLEKALPKKADKSMELFSNKFVKNAGKSNAGKKAGTAIADNMDDANYAAAADNSYSGFSNRFLSKNWSGTGDSAADAVLRKFKSKLGIKSPSRKFAEVAEFVYLGFANKMNDFNSSFYRVSANAAEAVNDGFRLSLNTLANVGLDSITEPTIRPVMDLSDVKMGVNSINSMFDAYTLRLSGNMDIHSQYDALDQRLMEQNDIQNKNMDKLVSAITENGIDPDTMYEAIRAGAADATLRLTLNGRELSRGLKDLGVKFR